MQLPTWIVNPRDAGAINIEPSMLKYGLAAGAGLALIAPNKFKVAGIALALISGGLLVTQAPTT